MINLLLMNQEELINYIKNNNELTTIYGEAGSGKTLILLSISKILKDNNPNIKILFIDGDHFSKDILENFPTLYNSIDFIQQIPNTEKDVDLICKNYNLIIGDQINFLINEENNELSSMIYKSRELKRIYNLFRLSSNKYKNKIFFSFIANRNMQGIQSLLYQGISHISETIIKLDNIPSENHSLISFTVTKSRNNINIIRKKYIFEIKTSDFSLLENPYIPKMLFFNNEVQLFKEETLINIMPKLDCSLDDFFKREDVKVSKKQIYQIWDELIIDKSILDSNDFFKFTKELQCTKINFNYLNLLFLLNKAFQNEFNLDLFKNTFNKTTFTFRNLKTTHNSQYENFLIDFIKDNFKFKKSLKLFKNFFTKEDYIEDGWNYLFGISIAYKDLISDIKIIKNIDANLIPFLSKEYIKKQLNKLSNPKDILLFLEREKRKLDCLRNDEGNKFLKSKMSIFYDKNKNLKSDNYSIEIPRDVNSILDNGYFFNNCTKNGFFIEKFIKDTSFLFYLKNKNNEYRDLCIHVDYQLNLKEVKAPSNKTINNLEMDELKFILSHLKI